MTASPDWAGSSGDIWAARWRDTDRALAAVGVALDTAIGEAAPRSPFTALDVGCGPGTTSLSLAAARPDATIVGCDISPALIAIAQQRADRIPQLRFVAEDAETAARERGPVDLIFSRHGVMFFDDPHRAFGSLRSASSPGGRLVFSCFQAWELNPWAAELASAAAGKRLPPPGREPSGFAFADAGYVGDILHRAGWGAAEPKAVQFDYVAGDGAAPVEQALAFLAEIGPAARLIEQMDRDQRDSAVDRMREVIARHQRGGQVTFAAAAWIWSAVAR